MEYTRTLTPSLSHSMGEGARRAGEGRLVVYPGHSVVYGEKCCHNNHRDAILAYIDRLGESGRTKKMQAANVETRHNTAAGASWRALAKPPSGVRIGERHGCPMVGGAE
jgi:hypothetical protein